MFPIILGVNRPQYTPEELEKLRKDNAEGVTVDGVHYTGYEAAQMQRKLETAIRNQRRKVMVDKAAGDTEKLEQDKAKLEILQQRYAQFSKAAGLRTQEERTDDWRTERDKHSKADLGDSAGYGVWGSATHISKSCNRITSKFTFGLFSGFF